MRTKGLVLALIFAAMSVGTQASSGQVVQVRGRGAATGNTPTASDMYCSGFITTDHVPTDHYVAAGWYSPDQTRFAAGIDYFYIHGRDIKVGDRYQIVRHVTDPDHYEFYSGARAAIRNAGEPYFALRYAKALDVQTST